MTKRKGSGSQRGKAQDHKEERLRMTRGGKAHGDNAGIRPPAAGVPLI
jgi:hypothetical protein